MPQRPGATSQLRSAVEAERDLDVLRFISRLFGFVTDELIAERFDVQQQQMNALLRRLAASGLVERTDDGMQPHLTMLSRKGACAVSTILRDARRAARTDAQRDPRWRSPGSSFSSSARAGAERECRTLKAADAGRYSVIVVGPGGRRSAAGSTSCSSATDAALNSNSN